MSDLRIKKNVPSIPIVGELRKKHLEIQINERKSLVTAYTQQLSDLINIQQKQIEFNIDCVNKEIEMLEAEYQEEQ